MVEHFKTLATQLSRAITIVTLYLANFEFHIRDRTKCPLHMQPQEHQEVHHVRGVPHPLRLLRRPGGRDAAGEVQGLQEEGLPRGPPEGQKGLNLSIMFCL